MKIATQNLYLKSQEKNKVDKLSKFFQEKSVNILAFQESTQEEVRQFKHYLNFEGDGYYSYEGWVDEEEKVRANWGTALLYEPAVLKLDSLLHVVLDNPPIVNDYGLKRSYMCSACKFTLSNRTLAVVSIHLALNYKQRMSELTVLINLINDRFSGTNGVIVLGDFNNNESGEPGYNGDVFMRDNGYISVWENLKPDTPCVTYRGVDWWVRNYPEHRKTRKFIKKSENFKDSALDFIFYKGDLNFTTIDTFDFTPHVSDHLGFIADFDFK